ncbi:MAG TPA: PDZ domain-containing protein, partial [Lacipirellulaceae bacterium]|nr:PDZ domain-containing protein [Lacipirellulaceae bacterium]
DAAAADDDPADDPPAERATPDGDDDDAEGADEPKDGADGASGVTLRAVWPGSPAEEAGLRAGDHIVRLGDAAVDSLAEALEAVSAHNPGDVLEVAARRGDQTLALRVTLAELPTAALSAEDLGRGEAADGGDGAATERGLQTFKLPELPQEVNYYLPAGEGPPPGVLVWLGDGRRETNEALLAAWRLACDRDRVALLMPEPGQRTGWTQDDLEFLARLLPAAISRFGADPRRVVVGGAGKGGQLAYALAFKGRKLVRGLAVMDSPLPRALEIPPNAPTGRLAVLSVETPNAPLTLLIRKDLAKLADAGIPATPVIRRSPPEGDQAIDAPTADAIARWMDGLDRF